MSKVEIFNEGVESGLKVSQKIIEQEVEAMDYLKSKIDLILDGHDEMKSAVGHLIADADEKAIAEIYGICNSVSPNELKDHEQKMLLSILATLGISKMNDDQKRFYSNLRHHLNIKGYEPDSKYDFRRIESLETVKAIKTIAKAVRIYLYLEESGMDGIYRHEDDLFSHFELRSYDEMDAVIETIVCLFDKEGLVEFYGHFEDDIEEDKFDMKTVDGIIINLKRLKQLKQYENFNCKATIEIAQKLAKLQPKEYECDKTYETNNHVVFKKNNKIYFFSKVSGESREFNIRDFLLDNNNLSEATSDDVLNHYVSDIFDGIKVYGKGFFFSIGARVYYTEICNNGNNCDLIIDFSDVWEEGNKINVKGLESHYFVFSYDKKVWCLLNVDDAELMRPQVLENRSDKFIVKDDFVYYVKAESSEYKKNKHEDRIHTVQVFQYNLITGVENPASKELHPLAAQQDGLGTLERFEIVGDKYIMLRKTYFSSSNNYSLIGLVLMKTRSSYLYMTFDSHFNPVSGDTFKSIEDDDVFFGVYCGNGILIYSYDPRHLKIISLISGKKTDIEGSEYAYLNLVGCGDYQIVLENGNVYIKSIIINTNDFVSKIFTAFPEKYHK